MTRNNTQKIGYLCSFFQIISMSINVLIFSNYKFSLKKFSDTLVCKKLLQIIRHQRRSICIKTWKSWSWTLSCSLGRYVQAKSIWVRLFPKLLAVRTGNLGTHFQTVFFPALWGSHTSYLLLHLALHGRSTAGILYSPDINVGPTWRSNRNKKNYEKGRMMLKATSDLYLMRRMFRTRFNQVSFVL
jgi:hypothetical protein